MSKARLSLSAACVLGAAGLIAFAGTAFGQNCPDGTNPDQCNPVGTCNGPDVIVGGLTGPVNYSSSGGFDAFSLGTTSCNIGNQNLRWIANTPEHPVISQNMFKMTRVERGYTTFEQLGQSWLKHGFYALSQNLCCSGCQATNGTSLGVHCSDPYTAERNGTQSGLGPKWQVNAASGAFTYPPANPPSAFTSVLRRLQVPIADLEPSSDNVRYFGAAQYVTLDDAAAGNKYNNESYQRINVTGSGSVWNMTLSGSTQRARQAIRAWGDFEEGVTYSDIFVPGDGLVIVAAKATQLVNGLWHYEYAVQNMNSDRSIGAFSIPVPEGVEVTDIGFRDVHYHSGDGPGNVNFSGTDWSTNISSGQTSSGEVSWATQTYAANPSANALRWGTLYNFRFNANTGPVDGVATLTLFKPGTPDAMESSSIPVPGSLPGAECPCDQNGDKTLNSQDFFDFLSMFFANSPEADFNADTTVNSQDFFDFLTCFFNAPEGC